MPKVRRVRSVSYDRSRASPYPSTSSDANPSRPKSPSGSADDGKEWEEARCPICMEHPHNVVLLKCSSHEKGCRPYMCNTSYRHSNCFDQFCKSSEPYSSTAMLQEIPLTSNESRRVSEEQTMPGQASPCGSRLESKLVCPLCRGDLFGYVVVEPARVFMNAKVRSCSSETCDFTGTYSQLRKHARSEHPSVRPTQVDPNRQHDWMRLERERDLDDVLSLVQPGFVGDSSEDPLDDFNSWVSSFFASMFRSIETMLVSRLLNASQDREQSHSRRSERMPRSHNNGSSSFSSRPSNNFHESDPRARRLRWRANYEAPTPTARRNYNSFQGRAGAPPRSRRLHWRNQRWSSYNNQQ